MDLPTLRIDEHPLLHAPAFVSELDFPLGECPTPEEVCRRLALEPEETGEEPGAPPYLRDEELRGEVRELLRYGGYRPTGRGKPASEYLVRAAGEGKLGSINLAVDACNATSLASGFPISVVDLDLVRGPLCIGIAEPGSSYVFNASGQEIDLSGLLCLHDASGPCASAVKDGQRTKTHAGTTRTLSVLWGLQTRTERVERTCDWYRALLTRAGAKTRLLRARRPGTEAEKEDAL